MKIAIVDDEAEAREEFLAGFQPDSFQLVFLDIRMEGMNGIETARLLRKQTAKLPIVFLTSSADYALEGYQVFSTGYLLKPIRQGRSQLLDILQHCLPQAPGLCRPFVGGQGTGRGYSLSRGGGSTVGGWL